MKFSFTILLLIAFASVTDAQVVRTRTVVRSPLIARRAAVVVAPQAVVVQRQALVVAPVQAYSYVQPQAIVVQRSAAIVVPQVQSYYAPQVQPYVLPAPLQLQSNGCSAFFSQ